MLTLQFCSYWLMGEELRQETGSFLLTLIHITGGLAVKSCLTLATPRTVACQATLSMGFSRQEYWSGLPFPSPGDLPNQGLNLGLLHCRKRSFLWISDFLIDVSLVAQTVKRLPTMLETQVPSLGREDSLENEMATHSSTLAWKIP